MTQRTCKKTVTFRRPFVLGGFDEVLPAGTYTLEKDEELLDGITHSPYRRASTTFHLHPKPSHPGLKQTLVIDPQELDAALRRDQAPAEMPVGADDGQKMMKGTTESNRREADSQAMERGEDEGMSVHSR